MRKSAFTSAQAGRPAVVALLPLACLLMAGADAPATAAPGAPGAPPMATREVTQFLRKERALHEAMASGRLELIDGLLSRDFVARPGASPGHPVLRAAWLQGSPAREFPGRIEQLVVRPLGSAALVSFVWLLPGDAGRVAVVDLWDGADENAHLLERHATPLGSTALEEGQPEPGPSRR